MKSLDIRSRVRLAVLLPVALIAFVQAFYFSVLRDADLDNTLHQRGREVVRHLAHAAEYGVFSGNREALRNLADATQSQSELQAVLILGRNGETLAKAGEPVGLEYLPIGTDAIEFTSPDNEILSFRYPILADRNSSAVIQFRLNDLSERKAEATLVSLAVLAVLLLAGWLISEYLSRRVLRQVDYIAEAVEGISQGNFDVQVATMAGGSLEHLSERINQMTRQLADSREDMRKRIAEATDELRLRKDEAERANVAKSRFLASASHDLRQPMHALGLFVAQLQSTVTNAESQHLVRQISDSVHALETLLDGLLDISKLDAGVLTPNISSFPLAPLLNRLSNDHSGPAAMKGLFLRVRPCDTWVRTDPALLERILLNLVANAVRYTKEGGILVACRRRGQCLRIEVRDSGIGIAPEAQDAVFQEFVQLHNASRNRGQGLGLGLAIVKRLVSLLQIGLQLRSLPGKGSVFAVEVPIATANEMAAPSVVAPTSTHPGNQMQGRVILVIDDDEMVLSGVSGLLASWGCQVISALSGRQAKDLIETGGQTPEAILCDYRLTESRNGIDVIRELRMNYGKSLPAALISGDTAPEVLRMAQEAGLALLHKPVAPAKLRTLLQRMLTKPM